LDVAKSAFKFIRDNPSGDSSEREQLLADLIAVIDRADPPSTNDDLLVMKLIMTNTTATALLDLLKKLSPEELDDCEFTDVEEILEAVSSGLRRTKQRAYLRLDLNPPLLRTLHYVLSYKGETAQEKSFKRMAKEIMDDGLAKNPMEIIGRMGL
jgi:hypothetical protein